MSTVLTGKVPSTVTGYSNITVTGVQLLCYPSSAATLDWGSAGDKWDTASATYGGFSGTTGTALAYNQIRMTANAPVGTRPLTTTYSSSETYNVDSASYDCWCSSFVSSFASTCASTKTATLGDSTAAAKIYQAGWDQGTYGKVGFNKLTLKANFTSAVANSASTKYDEKAASLYDYILAKYGSTEAGTSSYLSNFAGRTITSFANANTANPVVVSSNDQSSTFVLGGLAFIAIVPAGGYFFVRKKKSA